MINIGKNNHGKYYAKQNHFNLVIARPFYNLVLIVHQNKKYKAYNFMRASRLTGSITKYILYKDEGRCQL